ncbi:hypothetical protein PR003_g28714 [Phytophthora rubi]|uniref:Uncharacterized protein n=1 Tax=Phytophthora rubi TaxID=129364 RepID=A0A6A3HWH1_9STRA|nr:hypothetical protein PR002_g27671 [Phytophthora rubi]KAE8972313.1 hypothetical protein PR001_g26647 [Phytophthora rubi]KAE9277712.1 hypothetical protein PR003_g28714 [Phytophthora rubi]
MFSVPQRFNATPQHLIFALVFRFGMLAWFSAQPNITLVVTNRDDASPTPCISPVATECPALGQWWDGGVGACKPADLELAARVQRACRTAHCVVQQECSASADAVGCDSPPSPR